MIEVKHLIKTFPNGDTRLYALNDLSFSIETGSFVVILGASGSGKTTLLNVLSGLDKADSGDINFNDTNISTFDEHELIKFRRENVGFIFQAYYLLPTLNVEANIKMGANLAKNKHYADLIASLGLCGKEQKFPFELSGGQKRRVAIAGILAMNPRVLVLDEPTAGVDPRGRDEILGAIDHMHKETGITVILVSHSMEDIAKYVDRIIVMNKGSVMFNDVPKKVFAHYKELESVGLAAPQVTYIMHALKEKGMDVPTDATTIEEAADGIMKALKKERAAK